MCEIWESHRPGVRSNPDEESSAMATYRGTSVNDGPDTSDWDGDDAPPDRRGRRRLAERQRRQRHPVRRGGRRHLSKGPSPRVRGKPAGNALTFGMGAERGTRALASRHPRRVHPFGLTTAATGSAPSRQRSWRRGPIGRGTTADRMHGTWPRGHQDPARRRRPPRPLHTARAKCGTGHGKTGHCS